MALVQANLYLKDNPSQLNKEILGFIRTNMESIILRGRIAFKFRIVSSKDAAELREHNIDSFPTLLIPGEKPYVNVPTIKRALMNKIKMSRAAIAQKSDEEQLSDFMMKSITQDVSMGMGKGNKKSFIINEKEADEGDDMMEKIKARAAHEAQQRKIGIGAEMENNQLTAPPPPPPPNKRLIRDDDNHEQDRRPVNNISDNPMDVLNSMEGGEEDQMMRDLLGKMDFGN